MKTKPLGNNVLIEVQREYDGVSRADDNESLKVGKIIDFAVSYYHLTASASVELSDNFRQEMFNQLSKGVESKALVRWEEFAEGGQTFVENGKTYAIVPWWRLISVSEKEDE